MAKETKGQILDTAEALFAKHGFNQTSMRMITTEAGVNLASVNYHFGSKKNLIQAVLKRYFDELMPRLDDVMQQQPFEEGAEGVNRLLRAMIPPMLALNAIHPNGTEMFVQLLGRGYTETQGHLRRFIMGGYGATVHNLIEAIHQRLPQISDEQLFWRLHFALGTFVFSMASSQALAQIAQSDFDKQVNIADVIEQIVPFVAVGMAANMSSSQNS